MANKDEKEFFALPLETKKQYPYEGDTNLGYSIMGAENVDPFNFSKKKKKRLKRTLITITQECPIYGLRYSWFYC